MDYQAKQAAKAVAAKALQSANPWLVPVSSKNNSLIAAAKNARIELKRAFPGVTFSVKTSRFSMGDDMRVTWVDGPTADQVDAIIDRYAGGSFDGMTDSYNYTQDTWTDAFGEAKYVFSQRQNSDKALESAIRTVKAEYAGNLAARGITEITPAQFNSGDLFNVEVMDGAASNYWNLQQIIRRVVDKRTWALNKTPKSMPMVEADEVTA